MSTSKSEYLSCAETAKLIRPALKAAFPGVKFAVRSNTYSGGASIRIHWMDGPTQWQVEQVAKLFEGATFDGMQDLKSYHSSLLAGPGGNVREVRFGADFIFCERYISDGFAERCKAKLERITGESYQGQNNWREGVCIKGQGACLPPQSDAGLVRMIAHRTATKVNNPKKLDWKCGARL